MKRFFMLFIGLLVLSGCGGGGDINVKGNNNGASGGVTQSVRF